VVVGASLQRLAEGYFQLKQLGPARIKGVNDPVELFEVTGLGPLRTRLQVAARRRFTKFVGRQAELAEMRRALDRHTRGTARSSQRWASRGWASRACSSSSRRPPPANRG
jgi:hypothetical protein